MSDTGKPLVIGKAVPDFTAPATSGLNFRLSDYKGKSNLVIYFYPKDSTPGCTLEGQDFRDAIKAFNACDTEIFGVSKDSMKRHDNFREKQSFPFELISDVDESVCNLFNVIQLKKLYGKEYMGIVRSTFLIDKDGILRQHWDKVKVKGHVDEVLAAAQAL
jgi:peroxiredoxin Q/BCP